MPTLAPVIGTIALNLAIGIGSAVLAEIFRPKQTISSGAGTSRGISFEIDLGEERPVSAIVGKHMTAGHLLYANQYGTDNEFTQLKIDIGHGEHDGLELFLVDEKTMSLSGSNSSAKGMVVEDFKDGDGNPTMWIKTYTGAPGQVADPELVTRSNPSSRWGTNHKATGIAYHVITIKNDADLYGSRIPSFRFVWRGLKLYDWRKDSTKPGGSGTHRWNDPTTFEFTQNLYVIRWNYRRGFFVNGIKTVGLGFAEIFNDLDYYTAAANIADESLTDPDTSTVYNRYEYGRELMDTAEPLTILREMDSAGCGGSFSRGGADAPVPAQSLIPVMTLEDKHRIIGRPVHTNKFGSVSEKTTYWHGNFLSEAEGWRMSPYPERKSTSLEALIGRREKPFHQAFEHINERAQMRAEINLRRDLFPAIRTETFSPRAIKLQPGDAITRVCEWGSMLMIVQSAQRLPGNLGATLTLREWDNSIVPVSGQSFVTIPGIGGSLPNSPSRTLSVESFGIYPYQRAGAGGAQSPFGRANWTIITDTNVDQVLIRVWPTAGSEAADAEDFFANSILNASKSVGPLAPNVDYSFKAIPIRSDNRRCLWSPVGFFTSGDEIAAGVVPFNIGLELLEPAFLASLNFMSGNLRFALEKIEALSALVTDQDLSNFAFVTELRSEAQERSNGYYVRWNEDIVLATGPDSALGQRVETLETDYLDVATISMTDALTTRITVNEDEIDSQASALFSLANVVDEKADTSITDAFASRITVNEDGISASAGQITAIETTVGQTSVGAYWRMDTSISPSAGYTASMGMRLSASQNGTLHNAVMVMEVSASGSRILHEADKSAWKAGGQVVALFDIGGSHFNNARIAGLETHHMSAGTINLGTIGDVGTVLTSLLAGNAVTNTGRTTAGLINVDHGDGEKTLLSISISSAAGDKIKFEFSAKSWKTGGLGDPRYIYKLKRGSTVIRSVIWHQGNVASATERLLYINYQYSPPAGTYTYTITADYMDIDAGASADHQYLTLEYLKLKR